MVASEPVLTRSLETTHPILLAPIGSAGAGTPRPQSDRHWSARSFLAA